MILKFRYFIYTVLALFVLFVCVIFLFEDKNLGDGYLLWSDTAPSVAYKYGGGAYEVIPPKVHMLNYDNNTIIAMTVDIIDQKTKFWVINKDERIYDSLTSFFNKKTTSRFESILYSQRVGPMDSLSFEEYLKRNDINLILDSVRHPILPF
ncbi:MAG: hypothetical protein AAFQ94_03155 [Bacteroidota bacterium]